MRLVASGTTRLFAALRAHAASTVAVSDAAGTLTYAALLASAEALRHALPAAPEDGSRGRVAILTQPQAPFLAALLATWAAGATAVPLSQLYPPAALAPLLEDAEPFAVVAEKSTVSGLPDVVSGELLLPDGLIRHEASDSQGSHAHQAELQDTYARSCDGLAAACAADDAAMILFTSGTTGRPKGVVWRHSMLDYQVRNLSAVWRWSSDDRILNVLPLHHTHGLVNVTICALYNGAHLEMLPAFSASAVWSAFLRDESAPIRPPTVFMAVPAVYKKLIQFYEAASPKQQTAMRDATSRMRLFVCGSASLARRDFDAWTHISGQPILERYGMTETGMTLSNLYDRREQGLLGYPLPGVEARVVSEDDADTNGRLHVRGPGVFDEYWRRPQETRKAFTEDGWFDTGDIVSKDPNRNCFRMMGRASADIIKTGGYKVSAIEIEDVLRDCPDVIDCCVVGIADDVLGQRIVAAIMSPKGDNVIDSVRDWAMRNLPKYKVPRRFLVLDDFPRNVLGKVQKQVLRSSLE